MPFITVLSVCLGFIPATLFMADLLYSIKPITLNEEQKDIVGILTLSIGDVIDNPLYNCRLRIKALKPAFTLDLA